MPPSDPPQGEAASVGEKSAVTPVPATDTSGPASPPATEPPATEPPATPPQVDPPVSAQAWLSDDPAARTVLGAGMLAATPELVEALLTPTEWQAQFEAYAASARP